MQLFRARLKDIADGGENLDKIVDLYTAAYEGSGYTAEQIWEECICDSLGDMNIFAHDADISDFAGSMIREIKSAAQTDTESRETRGPPEGKTSRETEVKNKKITIGMSDSERTDILRHKVVSAPIYRGQADASIENNLSDLESRKRTVVENALIRIADEFNAKGDYKIEDVELEVSFSNKSVRESSNKSVTDPKQLAKLLPVLGDAVKSAIGIETHDNRYYYDNITKRFHELVGGYIDGDSFVPVRFGVKELNDGSCVLYVVICQEKIKTEVFGIQAKTKSVSHTPHSVNISIAQIAENVNTQNKDLLRYLPDGLLNNEQKKVKNTAIAETIEYTNAKNDKAYIEAIETGDMPTAKKILQNAAKAAGYSSNSDYQGTSAFNGAAPSNEGYYNSVEERVAAWEDGSFEGSWSLADELKRGIEMGDLEFRLSDREYRFADSMRKEAIRNIRSVRDKNLDQITMYRSVPSNIKESSFRNGDWITPSKSYARENAEIHGWGENYRIIEQIVSIEDVWWDGNDIAEWGYDNGNPNEVYKNTPNNVKLLEPTYDDRGQLIPISKRFDERTNDARYSRETAFEADSRYLDAFESGGERAMREMVDEAAVAWGVQTDVPKITLDNVEDLRSIGRKSINAFTSEDIKKAEPWARKFYAELGTKSPFFRAWFGDWRAYDTNSLQKIVAKDNKRLENGRATNSDTGKVISWNAHTIYNETKNHATKDKVSIEAISQLSEIVEKAILLDTVISEPSGKTKMPNTAFMHSMYAVYDNGSGRYLLKLYVEEALSNNGQEVFTRAYQLKDIQKVADLPDGVSEGKPSLSDDKSATIDSIADLHELVKTYDKDFSPKDVNSLNILLELEATTSFTRRHNFICAKRNIIARRAFLSHVPL